MASSDINARCVNELRALCADVVQKADSGHPGAPMGMAPLAHVLWTQIMNYNPVSPFWLNRDRFVLSNGHACALLYSLLHLTGFEAYTLEELKRFRQIDSKTPGHPENHFPGIEVTTGPLGQGFCNAVGIAMAQAHLGGIYNKPGFEILNSRVYCTVGDGCLQEGLTAEAASLAGHLGLGRLIVLYDDNKITIDGDTGITFTEDVLKRFEAYGWHTQTVTDGDNNLKAIHDAVINAQQVLDKPSLIKIRTTIGYGSKLAGTHKVHGAPLGEKEIEAWKSKYGLNPKEKFNVSPEALSVYRNAITKGTQVEKKWNALFEKYSSSFPKEANEIKRKLAQKLPEGWQDALPRYKPTDKPSATRQASQLALQKLAPVLPELFGGSADLAASNLTDLPGTKDFQKESYAGRNIRFGIREHAMAAICNGIAAFSPGYLIPFGATFLNFIGYAMGAVTLSALSQLGVIYVMTHDSIGLGEDGPTHQPVEKLLTLRATPSLNLFRPADGNETSGAYLVAIENRKRPSVLSLCRQTLPQLQGSSVEAVRKGAYVLQDSEGGQPQAILVGTGSEVAIAVEAAAKLKERGLKVRVVSMPCWRLFDEQPQSYRDSVFLKGVPVVSIEAATTFGWDRYADLSLGMDDFGHSGPFKEVYKKVGLTVENLVEKTYNLVKNPRSRL